MIDYLSQEVGGQVLVDAESSSLLSEAGQSNGGGGVELSEAEARVRSCLEMQPKEGRFFIYRGGKREQLLRRFRTLAALSADAAARLRPMLNIAMKGLAAAKLSGERREEGGDGERRRFGDSTRSLWFFFRAV